MPGSGSLLFISRRLLPNKNILLSDARWLLPSSNHLLLDSNCLLLGQRKLQMISSLCLPGKSRLLPDRRQFLPNQIQMLPSRSQPCASGQEHGSDSRHQLGAQITLAGVGQHGDNPLARVLGSGGDFFCRRSRCAGGDAAEDAF